MKKVIVAALALLISVGASAEGFGIVGGFTSSQMKFKDLDLKSSAGIHAGFAYNIPLGLGFAFQPELIYNVKGFNWNGLNEGDGSKEWDKAKYGYVEVPLQLQWGIDLVMLRPYAFVEPFAGYAVTGSKVINSQKAKIDFENAKSRLEYGLGVGAGLEFMSKVQLSFKYFWNFENAQSFTEIKDTVKDGKSFNGLIFSVGLFF